MIGNDSRKIVKLPDQKQVELDQFETETWIFFFFSLLMAYMRYFSSEFLVSWWQEGKTSSFINKQRASDFPLSFLARRHLKTILLFFLLHDYKYAKKTPCIFY